MVNKIVLRNRKTRRAEYPVTSEECIFTRDFSGVATKNNVKTLIANFVESTPAYIETIDSIKNRLKEKPDEALALTQEITKSHKAAIIELWKSVSGIIVDADNDIYGMNGLNDLTYKEVLEILMFGQFYKMSGFQPKTRTIIPLTQSQITDAPRTTYSYFCYESDQIEVLFCRLQISGGSMNFHSCPNLKCIGVTADLQDIDAISATFCSSFSSWFTNLPKLEEIRITIGNCSGTLSFADSPLLSKESFEFLIANAVNTEPITITVHQNIYNALLEQDTEYPFNGGTQEDWKQLLQKATEKQISFSTKTL